MASIFDYQFNVGGNFTAAMDGMAESTGRFAAAVETSTQGLSKWEQKLAAFGLIGDYVDRACNAVNGIVEVGANAELQLMNLKTLFGGNAEAAKEMYERISEYGKKIKELPRETPSATIIQIVVCFFKFFAFAKKHNYRKYYASN